MKSDWSPSWESSKQPRKQRKYLFNLPLHLVHKKMLVAHLAQPLRHTYKRRSVPIRQGDIVTVLRGQFKGKIGTVDKVLLGRRRVFVTGIHTVKKNGTTIPYPLVASNLLVTQLHLEDKKRVQALSRGHTNG